MASQAVHWEEGMFLTPQHFQAAERHTRRALREAEDWFHPFDWGFRSLLVDDLAVASNARVVLRSCEARFKDGTHVTVGEGHDVPPLTIDLTDVLVAKDVVDV